MGLLKQGMIYKYWDEKREYYEVFWGELRNSLIRVVSCSSRHLLLQHTSTFKCVFFVFFVAFYQNNFARNQCLAMQQNNYCRYE